MDDETHTPRPNRRPDIPVGPAGVLARRLEHEVRKQRIVLVDDDGTERMVAEVNGSTAVLRLELPGSAAGRTTGLLLFTTSGSAERPPGFGVQLWADGNAIAELNGWQIRRGRWLADLDIP